MKDCRPLIDKLLSQITYKRCTTIRSAEYQFETLDGSVIIIGHREDAEGKIPGTIPIYSSMQCSSDLFLAPDPEKHFLWLLRRALIQFETHEVDEFLRFKGQYVEHPHPAPQAFMKGFK